MMSRSPWIAAFIGYVSRQGHVADPVWISDTADTLYFERGALDPAAADSDLVAWRPERLTSAAHWGLEATIRDDEVASRRHTSVVHLVVAGYLAASYATIGVDCCS